MTPEQENELVARWMGWEYGAIDEEGNKEWFREIAPLTDACRHDVPDYRTDPALLWELACRLASTHCGEWVLRLPSVQYRSEDDFHMQPFTVGFAEAVFAAAVMQAEQEGK